MYRGKHFPALICVVMDHATTVHVLGFSISKRPILGLGGTAFPCFNGTDDPDSSFRRFVEHITDTMAFLSNGPSVSSGICEEKRGLITTCYQAQRDLQRRGRGTWP